MHKNLITFLAQIKRAMGDDPLLRLSHILQNQLPIITMKNCVPVLVTQAVFALALFFLLAAGPRIEQKPAPGAQNMLAVLLGVSPAHAQSNTIGTATKPGPTGLPIPRFVSLKADRVNVRQGPNQDHKVSWVYRRVGLPVEIIAEFEHWRQIRDSEGATGWIFHTLLSGRRTVLVLPWIKAGQDKTAPSQGAAPEQAQLYEAPSATSKKIIAAAPGVLGNVLSCTRNWCRLAVGEYRGWIEQEKLWGVYKDEAIN